MRRAPEINLTDKQRKLLERAARATRSNPQRLVDRANIVLLAAQGLENKDIAQQLGQDRGKVGRWRQRYAQFGMDGIVKDKTRPGRIPATPSKMALGDY